MRNGHTVRRGEMKAGGTVGYHGRVRILEIFCALHRHADVIAPRPASPGLARSMAKLGREEAGSINVCESVMGDFGLQGFSSVPVKTGRWQSSCQT